MQYSKACVATSVSFLFGTFGSVSAQDAPADASNAVAIEEIIVTAQKREQALAEIPMSITVLDGVMLETQQADNFQDLVALVPGLSFTSAERGVTRLTLRGINTGGVASTVGVYVADTPFGSSTSLANGAVLSGDFDTFDLARIEVLRGPQGTLYGATSLGGVLKYVPNPANTEKFEGRLQGSLESVQDADPGYAIAGVVNVPMSDQFAIRASGFYRVDEGYIDSIGNNPIPALQDPSVNVLEGTFVQEGLNTLDTFGGRLQALYQPSDNFSINLMALLQDIESGAPTTIDADADTFEPLNSSPVQSRYQDSYSDVAYEVYSGTIDWGFSGLSLQSVTSYGTFERTHQADLAALVVSGAPLSSLMTLVFDDLTTAPIENLLSGIQEQITSTDKFTQEFRLLSADSDQFEWLVGLYYNDEDSLIDQLITTVVPGTNTPIPAGQFPVSPPAITILPTDGLPIAGDVALVTNYKEIALFGNATWHVTDQFELSFGARQSDNEQTARQTTEGILAGGSAEDFGESSESPFTWSFSPRYTFNEDNSIYLRVATGFRPGGPNVVPPTAPPEVQRFFDSDTLTSYEVGYKSTFADAKFALDVAAYYLDWEDIQLLIVVDDFGINANGGTAVSKGAEFTASFFPSDSLTLSFNGAYTDAYLTEDTDPVAVGGLNGDPLLFVPDWGFGLSADYEWAFRGDSTAYVGGTLGYTGDRPYDFMERESDGSLSEIDGYTTLNLRTGLRTERWNFELYGKNVTDELGITAVGTGPTSPAIRRVDLAYIRPATYGLLVGLNF